MIHFSILDFSARHSVQIGVNMKKCSYVVCLLGSILMVLAGDFFYGTYIQDGIANAADHTEVLDENMGNISAVKELSEDTSQGALMPIEGSVKVEEQFSSVSYGDTDIILEKNQQMDYSKEQYEGALYIGDSRTVGLHEYGNITNGEVFANSGMSVFNLLKAEEVVGEREKQTLEMLLDQVEYDTIHIMLGINELGYDFNKTILQYQYVLNTIEQLQPNAIIMIGANLHVTGEKSDKDKIYNNTNINKINQELKKIAEEKGYSYIDINEVFDDTSGNLDTKFTSDGAHVLGKYYADWVIWLQEKMGK